LASLDFEQEKKAFISFYDTNRVLLEEAKNACISAASLLLKQVDVGEITKIEGRVKNKEECIKKFQRKYQGRLEMEERPYAIKDYLSDLLGIRIVCLYEDQIPLIAAVLKENFEIIEVTDKIATLEKTNDLFGYKGLHMDLVYDDRLLPSEKHLLLRGCCVEVQIRSLIQDAWSVLDHKIKYKKSIPNDLKRRINVLAALFELADREFIEIRSATSELLQQETDLAVSEGFMAADDQDNDKHPSAGGKKITAFNFLRVAGHFFKDFDFKDYKVDNFVQEILKLDCTFERADLHKGLLENIKTAREYRDSYLANNPDSSFSPYTLIRHCLYLYDRTTFERILSRGPKERFERWLAETGQSAQND